MKTCPTCQEEFADKFDFCAVDGTPLNSESMMRTATEAGIDFEGEEYHLTSQGADGAQHEAWSTTDVARVQARPTPELNEFSKLALRAKAEKTEIEANARDVSGVAQWPVFDELLFQLKVRYRPFAERQCNRIRRKGGTPIDPDEMIQQLLVRVFQKIEKYSGESQFDTWIYKVALNIAWDSTKEIRGTHVELDESCEYAVTASTDDEDEKATVRETFRDLDPESRELLELKHIVGYTAEEIAARDPKYRYKRNVQRKLKRAEHKFAIRFLIKYPDAKRQRRR